MAIWARIYRPDNLRNSPEAVTNNTNNNLLILDISSGGDQSNFWPLSKRKKKHTFGIIFFILTVIGFLTVLHTYIMSHIKLHSIIGEQNNVHWNN